MTEAPKKTFFDTHWEKILELQNFLSKHQFFSKNCLPGKADALMFQIFDTEFPPKQKFPSLYYWYINLKQFSPESMKSWELESDQDKELCSLLEAYKANKQNLSFMDYIEQKNSVTQSQKQSGTTFIMNVEITQNMGQNVIKQVKKYLTNRGKIIEIKQISKTLVSFVFVSDDQTSSKIKQYIQGFSEVISLDLQKQVLKQSQQKDSDQTKKESSKEKDEKVISSKDITKKQTADQSKELSQQNVTNQSAMSQQNQVQKQHLN